MLIRWQKTIVDRQGNVQPGAVLTVRREANQSLAKVYRDRNRADPYPTGTVTADENGYAYFYADADTYRITSTKPAIDWRDEGLTTAVIDFAGQTYISYDSPSDKRMVDDTSQPVGTLGRVTNDADPDKNGDYVMTASGWAWAEVQPATAQTIDNAIAALEGATEEVLPIASLISKSGQTPGLALRDSWGFVGAEINSDSFYSGAVSLIRRSNRYSLLGLDRSPIRTYVMPLAEDDFVWSVMDPWGFRGAGLRKDGEFLAASASPSPTDGNPAVPAFFIEGMRNLRMRAARLKFGSETTPTTLNIGIIGDSFTNSYSRYIRRLAQMLMRELGDGGGGWIGFSWNTEPSHGNTRQGGGGVTPEGTRGDLSAYGISILSQDGRWECDRKAGGGPDMGIVRSTAVGAAFTVAYYPDKALEMVGGTPRDMTRLELHYDATQPCTLEYRWNGSEVWETLVLESSGGPSVIDFSTPPAGKAWVDVRVASGQFTGFGCFAYSEGANGVTVSKMGVNGSSMREWSMLDYDRFTGSLSNVPFHAVYIMLGTNDQGQAQTAEQFRVSTLTLLEMIRAALPLADICIVMPPENLDPNRAPYPMAAYAAEARQICRDQHVAFMDMQSIFGPTSSYVPHDPLGLFEDNVHPSGPTGGCLMADWLFRSIVTTL